MSKPLLVMRWNNSCGRQSRLSDRNPQEFAKVFNDGIRPSLRRNGDCIANSSDAPVFYWTPVASRITSSLRRMPKALRSSVKLHTTMGT